MLLTDQHQPAPRLCQYGKGQVETKVLIARKAWATLAANDIYRHETAPGDAPLKPPYTEWELDGGIYRREPTGTDEQRAEATAVQSYAAAEADRQANSAQILDVITEVVIAPMVEAESLDDSQIARLGEVGAFPAWQPGVDYPIGTLLTFDSKVVKVIQPHTSQLDWTPDVAVSLFVVYRPPGEISAWVQPSAENPYMTGDQVTHDGATWTSDLDGNVWEPGVYGWTENT